VVWELGIGCSERGFVGRSSMVFDDKRLEFVERGWLIDDFLTCEGSLECKT
jgi:hypothetical protein